MRALWIRGRLALLLRSMAALGLIAGAGCGGPGEAPPATAADQPKPVPKVTPATKKNPLEKPFDPRERLKGKKPSG
jgi:hypothetical protein